MYATPVTTLLVGGIRGMRSFAGGGASPSHPIRGKLWSGSRAFRQPNDIRERGTTECGRTEPGRTLRDVEQSADEKPRRLDDIEGISVGWHGLPPGAPSHRCRKAPESRLPPHLVP